MIEDATENLKKHFKRLLYSLIILSLIVGCVKPGPPVFYVQTKPNPVHKGIYPTILSELKQKNPLLAKEILKLPELQDGISKVEQKGLEAIAGDYNSNPAAFNSVFKEIYQIGIPGVREYCTPLQAYFWLAEDGKHFHRRDILNRYSLEDLLDRAWKAERPVFSESQISSIVSGILTKFEKNRYSKAVQVTDNRTLQVYIFNDYDVKPYMFSEKGRGIIAQLTFSTLNTSLSSIFL